MQKNNSKQSPRRLRKSSAFLVGAGFAAAVTTGILAFLTQTNRGKRLTKDARHQLLDVTKNIAKRAEEVKDMTKATYEKLVDDAVGEVKKRRAITKEVASDLAKELKREWARVRREWHS